MQLNFQNGKFIGTWWPQGKNSTAFLLQMRIRDGLKRTAIKYRDTQDSRAGSAISASISISTTHGVKLWTFL